MQCVQDGFGTANTALIYHANKLLALHEGDLPYAVSPLLPIAACPHLHHILQLNADAMVSYFTEICMEGCQQCVAAFSCTLITGARLVQWSGGNYGAGHL